MKEQASKSLLLSILEIPLRDKWDFLVKGTE